MFYSLELLKIFFVIYKKKLSKVKYIIICSIYFCCVLLCINLNCYYFLNGIKWFWFLDEVEEIFLLYVLIMRNEI